MSTIKVTDGVDLFYKDWGTGQPVVFCHGWPLTADAWDPQMLFLVNEGYRVIAHDRRSHGRSTQVGINNTMDAYADDLAALIEFLELRNVILVGHSTGGGEVVRYIARHGCDHVAKAVLIGSVPPVMLKSASNPEGTPMEVFDALREGVTKNRSQFFKDLSIPFFGFNRNGAVISEGVREHFWLQGMLGGIKGEYDCIAQFSETDFTEDLKQIAVPTLLLHGDDDQIVPFGDASVLSAKLIPNSTLKVFPGLAHGMVITHSELINNELLDFIKS
ncbi:alpha/beta fold hydrolase [Granulicella arctica]|uniref:alpha/beta fold hydrolase n=1 Tax=Granulicella arctica TaxID=940613 RepID=UPI001C547AA7|nr:alpha/beta hydrolase [Granulicella arctica]